MKHQIHLTFVTALAGVLTLTLSIGGCSADNDDDRDKDATPDTHSDVVPDDTEEDTEVEAETDAEGRRWCDSMSIDRCIYGEELCVNTRGPYCGEFLGHCMSIPDSCEAVDWGSWRACSCNGVGRYSNVCEARRGWDYRRMFLCLEPSEGRIPCVYGQEDDTCGEQEVCVAEECDWENGCQGACVPIEEACVTAPTSRVCASVYGRSGLSDFIDCWSSPCEAWHSGYRGPLAIDE